MFSRPEFTTLVVIFVFYTNMSVVAIRGGVPEILALSFFLLLGLPLLYALFVEKKPFIVNTVIVLMMIYLAFILMSAITSVQPSASYSRVNNFVIEGLILYILIVNCVRTNNILQKSIWALILAGGLIGSLSVYQGVTGDYENDFGGLAQVSNAAINAGEETFLGEQRTVSRLAGHIGEKNRYAQTMVVLLPLAVSRIFIEKSLRKQALAAVCGVFILGGTLLSFSRGAGITVFALCVAMGVLRIVPFRYWLIVALSAPLLMFVFAPDYFERISTLSGVSELASGNTDEADGSILGRATENLGTFIVFLEHPLLGVGPGQVSRYIREAGNQLGLRHLTEDRRAHNMYLEELADTGILGFAPFISILGYTVWRLYTLMRYWQSRNHEYFHTLAALLLAVFAYMVTAIFLHLSYARYYWFLLAIAGAGIYVFSQAQARSNGGKIRNELDQQSV
jgi:O-antigen ligase